MQMQSGYRTGPIFVRIAIACFAGVLGLMASAAWSVGTPPSDAFRAPSTFTIEPSRRMQAAGYKWDHEIRIALPASYAKSNKAYPVLWVMDGSFLFEHAVLALSVLNRGQVPEMIVVGVGVPPEASADTAARRIYDFTPAGQWDFEGFGAEVSRQKKADLDKRMQADGLPLMKEFGGAPAFLAFLVDAVRPALARDYRLTEDHTLFGESAGGLFCTYALFARPAAFDKYLCASSSMTFGNYELFRMEERYARDHKDLPAKVLFTAGENEILQGDLISASGAASGTARMAEILSVRNYPSLKLRARIFHAEDHASVISANFNLGLRTLWEGESGKR